MIIQKQDSKKYLIGITVLKKYEKENPFFRAVVKITGCRNGVDGELLIGESANKVIKAIKIMKKLNKEKEK